MRGAGEKKAIQKFIIGNCPSCSKNAKIDPLSKMGNVFIFCWNNFLTIRFCLPGRNLQLCGFAHFCSEFLSGAVCLYVFKTQNDGNDFDPRISQLLN